MIQLWEGGYSLPIAVRLKNSVEIYLGQGVSLSSREQAEVRELWRTVKDLADANSTNYETYPIFDEGWFDRLLQNLDRKVAELLIAEIGVDMSRFPAAAHLASWAGVAPSNNRSAGKQLPGRIAVGDRPLRKGLIQAALAAAKSKKSYLGALYARVAAKRGKGRAIIAVAHSILVSVYYMLTRKEEYKDMGYGYLEERQRGTVTKRLVRRLERLGYQVNLSAPQAQLA